MNRNSMEEFHRTPDLYLEIELAARRERARAIRAGYKWLVGKLATWLDQAKARLAPRILQHPARWIARLG